MALEDRLEEAVHILIRPGLAVAMLAAQFLGDRQTVFTANTHVLVIGIVLLAASVGLWVAATVHCSRATRAGGLATTGPYRTIRHPIYAGIILMSLGMGFVFFTWLHLVVVAAFFPLWCMECRREERHMAQAFGEAYETYRNQTAMLIPAVL